MSSTITEASYHDAETALERLITNAAASRILVIGDVMLDEFVFGSVQRISPEAPVPVVEITGRRFAPGGAANVASNVAAFGATALLAGVTGDDEAADGFRRVLDAPTLDTTAVLRDPGRPTSCKSRIVASGQQIVRIDHESRAPLSEAVQQNLIQAAVTALHGADACVISDYGKGVVSTRLVASLVNEAKARQIPVLVDPKGHDYRKYNGVSLITPNLKEAELAAGHPIGNDDDIIQAAARIVESAHCEALLITQGASGMTLFREGHAPLHSTALAHQVFDVTGAGDTVVAMLALGMGCSLPIEDAMLLANIAAGIVVEKPGTATVSLREITDLMRDGYHLRARA
jgi:D-beta-D-heptose 7-phosphate kinase/D-beta-D-heptose 1-phosphate adenosyltransferase